MNWTKYAIFLAAIVLAIWLLHRKGISTFHIALIVLSYLVIIALIFLALILIVDRNLATTKGLLRFSQKSLRLAHHDGERSSIVVGHGCSLRLMRKMLQERFFQFRIPSIIITVFVALGLLNQH